MRSVRVLTAPWCASDEWLRRRQISSEHFIRRRIKICFELIGAKVVQGGVHAVLIVEAIDVVDNASGRVFVAFIGLSTDLLRFVAFEKTLHWCVVIAVAFTAHALQTVAPEKSTPILATSKLRAAIAVEDQASLGAAKCDRLVERSERQKRVDRATGGPADDLSGEEILNGAKVRESFESVNVSEVCEPNTIWLLRNEYLVQTVGSDR